MLECIERGMKSVLFIKIEKKTAIRSQFNIVILNDVVCNYTKCHQGHATLVGRRERSNNTKAILNSCL